MPAETLGVDLRGFPAFDGPGLGFIDAAQSPGGVIDQEVGFATQDQQFVLESPDRGGRQTQLDGFYRAIFLDNQGLLPAGSNWNSRLQSRAFSRLLASLRKASRSASMRLPCGWWPCASYRFRLLDEFQSLNLRLPRPHQATRDPEARAEEIDLPERFRSEKWLSDLLDLAGFSAQNG